MPADEDEDKGFAGVPNNDIGNEDNVMEDGACTGVPKVDDDSTAINVLVTDATENLDAALDEVESKSESFEGKPNYSLDLDAIIPPSPDDEEVQPKVENIFEDDGDNDDVPPLINNPDDSDDEYDSDDDKEEFHNEIDDNEVYTMTTLGPSDIRARHIM